VKRSLLWVALAVFAAPAAGQAPPGGAPLAPAAGAVAEPTSPAALGPVELRIPAGKRASLRRLPQANGGIIEMVMRGVDENLQAALRGDTPNIAGMDAVRQGGGVWLLRFKLRDPSRDLVGAVVDGDLVLSVVDRTARAFRLRVQPPTLQELLAGDLPPAPPEPAPPSHFRFLPGDAIAEGLQPWAYRAELVRTPELMFTPTWERIDEARAAMLAAAPGSRQEQEQMYYLGYYYLQMGFGREARHYFSRISNRPGPIPQRDVELERARAALAVGRFDEARGHYAEAARLQADHDSVVEGLAVLSLATADPPRAPTARLLWSSTSAPGALLLAAELLQMDGRVAESRYILESVKEDVPDDQRERWSLRLGDARFADGDLQGAMAAWDGASPGMRAVRTLFYELHKAGGDPALWARQIPALVQASMARDDAGAEALYLLSQIDSEIMASEDAINDLAILLQRHPEKAEGSDVPERFWEVYSSYVEQLADAALAERARADAGAEGAAEAALARWSDIAAIHEAVWHRSVRRAVSDPQPLLWVARAYEEVGLAERAGTVLRDAVAVLVARGTDDPELVLRTAELYAKVGYWEEALDSLEYLAEMDGPAPDPGRVALLEATLFEGLKRLPEAEAALRRALEAPSARADAAERLAVLGAEANRCAGAVEVLLPLLDPARRPTLRDPRPVLALARCGLLTGDRPLAARAGRLAAELTSLDKEARFARWLVATAEGWTDQAEAEALAAGEDFWAVLAREEMDAEAFAGLLADRASLPWSR
jgi:tetratricopeptide (TPR) repeat protein